MKLTILYCVCNLHDEKLWLALGTLKSTSNKERPRPSLRGTELIITAPNCLWSPSNTTCLSRWPAELRVTRLSGSRHMLASSMMTWLTRAWRFTRELPPSMHVHRITSVPVSAISCRSASSSTRYNSCILRHKSFVFFSCFLALSFAKILFSSCLISSSTAFSLDECRLLRLRTRKCKDISSQSLSITLCADGKFVLRDCLKDWFSIVLPYIRKTFNPGIFWSIPAKQKKHSQA